MKEIKECDYKPDFEICDRYINFSSELLRISLLALTGLGAFILLTFNPDSNIKFITLDKVCLIVVTSLFALCTAATLFHRYHASDYLSYHIAYLRKGVERDKKGGHDCLNKSRKWLIASEITFGLAVSVFVFAVILFVMKHT